MTFRFKNTSYSDICSNEVSKGILKFLINVLPTILESLVKILLILTKLGKVKIVCIA